MAENLPTARNTLPKASWLCLFVWCKARSSIVPLVTKTAKRWTAASIEAWTLYHNPIGRPKIAECKGGIGVQPWRQQAG
jgi:hypothetical protein